MSNGLLEHFVIRRERRNPNPSNFWAWKGRRSKPRSTLLTSQRMNHTTVYIFLAVKIPRPFCNSGLKINQNPWGMSMGTTQTTKLMTFFVQNKPTAKSMCILNSSIHKFRQGFYFRRIVHTLINHHCR